MSKYPLSVAGKLAAVFLAALLIWAFVKVMKSRVVRRIEDSSDRYRARKFLDVIGFLVLAVFITIVYRGQLGGLTVALGIVGAGVAFALQEVIASVAGWLAILMGGFFKTGDRIQLGGIKGDVVDIGVLRTTLMEIGQWVDSDLYNGRVVRIANSFVFKEPVFNFSGDFPFLWDEIKVPVQYGSDYQKTKELFQRIVDGLVQEHSAQARERWGELTKKYRIEQAQIEPMVTLVANDNWVEYTIRYVVDFKKRRSTKSALFTRILKEVEASQGAIKFASTTVHLVEAPEVKVRLSRE